MGWSGDSSIGDTLKRSPHRAGFFFFIHEHHVLLFSSAPETAVCSHLYRIQADGCQVFPPGVVRVPQAIVFARL